MNKNLEVNIKKNKYKLFENVFLTAYVLYIVQRNFNNSTIRDIMPFAVLRGVKILIIALLITCFFMNLRYKRKSIYSCVIIIILCSLVAYKGEELNLLCIGLFVIQSQFVSFDKIIKVNLITTITVVGITVALCFAGLLPNYSYSHYSLIFHTRIQAYALGFCHYSTPSYLIFYISIMIMYYKRNIVTYMFLVGINLLTYVLFTTKLPFFLILLFIIVSIFLEKKQILEKKRKIISALLSLLPIIMMVVSYILSVYYNPNNAMMNTMNSFFSDRFRQGQIGLNKYGISILGQSFEMVGVYSMGANKLELDSYLYIDSDYLYLPMHFGIVLSLLVIGVYSFMIKKLISEKNYYYLSWIIIIVLFAFVNWCLINIESNPLIFAGMRLLNNESLNTGGRKYSFNLRKRKRRFNITRG